MFKFLRLVPLLALAACDGVFEPSTLIASPNEVRFDALRQSASASVIFTGTSYAGPSDVVQWETADPNVAVVNASGSILSTGNGETTITVRRLGRAATIKVIVDQVATSFTAGPVLPNSSFTALLVGQTVQGFATAQDRGGEPILNPPVAWSTLTPNVLQVSPTGQIRALAPGQGIVLARIGALSTQLTYNVQ